MDDYAKIVGRNLHDLRSAYRMTQVDLGKKLQCGEANISYWERGKAVPRGDYLPELAKIFHVSIDSLFGMDRATDRIMELQTENTALRRQIENLTSAQAAMVKEFDKKLEELAQVKAERDAAVSDIEKIAKGGKTWMCPYCKHGMDTGYGFADCDIQLGGCKVPFTMFEWRGPQKEGT